MTEWKQARKKPVIVEFREVKPPFEELNTGHGYAFAYPDEDFIIHDEVGEYPIKKSIFYETYDVLETPYEAYVKMREKENE